MPISMAVHPPVNFPNVQCEPLGQHVTLPLSVTFNTNCPFVCPGPSVVSLLLMRNRKFFTKLLFRGMLIHELFASYTNIMNPVNDQRKVTIQRRFSFENRKLQLVLQRNLCNTMMIECQPTSYVMS